MIPQNYVDLAIPVTLNLRVGGHGPPMMREFSRLPLVLFADMHTRVISARLPPIPAGLVLYGEDDFLSACGDTMEEHAARVLQILGGNAAAVLQSLINGEELPPLPQRPVSKVSKLKLRRALREIGMEDKLDAFLTGKALADWNDAQFLLVTDPLLSVAVPEFAKAAGIPAEQVMALFLACRD